MRTEQRKLIKKQFALFVPTTIDSRYPIRLHTNSFASDLYEERHLSLTYAKVREIIRDKE